MDLYFYQDNCLYIVYKFLNNGYLGGFLGSYKSLDKPIDPNTLWNIFMQCISALYYIHSNNIIHKNIRLSNFFCQKIKFLNYEILDFHFWQIINVI